MRYKGENLIEFSCDEKNNVTIILGDNTFGKTTIAQAFRWGLYGYDYLNTTSYVKKQDIVLLNNEVAATLGENSEGRVTVEITILDTDLNEEIIIRRTERFKKKTMSPNDISVKRVGEVELTMQRIEDGIPGKVINNDGSDYRKKENNYTSGCVQDYIENVLPSELSSYFFFDGERWNERGKQTTDIKNSVNTILGISELLAMKKHLKEGRPNVIATLENQIVGITGETKKLQQEMEEIREKIELDEKKIQSHTENMEILQKDIKDLKSKLEQYSGSEEMKNQLNEAKKDLERFEKNQDNCYREIISMFSNTAEYIAGGLADRLVGLLHSIDLEGKDIPGVTVDTVNYLIEHGECLCGECVAEGTKGYETLIKLKKVIPPEMLGGASRKLENVVEGWKNNYVHIAEQIEEKAQLYLENQDAIDDKQDLIDKLEARIDKRANTEVVRSNYKVAKRNYKDFEDEKNRLIAEVEFLRTQLEKRSGELEKLAIENEKNETINRALVYAKKIYEKTCDRAQSRQNILLQELNKLIEKNFEKMFHEKEKVARLGEDFKIHVSYKNLGNDITKDETALSMGEKVAINFVFIVSILELAKIWREEENKIQGKEDTTILKLPLVLDAPFSNLSDTNTELVAASLPEFAEQVIIFMLDKDWEGSGLEKYTKSRYCYRVNKEANANSSTIEQEV